MSGRIVLAVTGSYGDVNPFTAVALELQRRGRDVVLAAPPEYAAKVASAGLPFAPMRPGWNEAFQLAPTAEAVVRDLVRDDWRLFRDYLVPHAWSAYEDVRPLLDGADLVVVSHMAFGAQLAAEATGTPLAVLALQPSLLLSAYDPPATHAAPWLPALRDALGPAVARGVVDLGFALRGEVRDGLNVWRAKAGLAPAGTDWFYAGVRTATVTVGLWSPLLGRLQPDHPPNTLIAGSLAYDDEPDLQEAELEAFLQAGPAPFVVTLGSFAAQAPGRVYRDGIAAARRCGLRTVVVGGPQAPEANARLGAEDVLVTGYARYSRLFPRARVVAHHGGIGTSTQALRAGVPQIVLPMFGDQPDNARRLARLDVARVVPAERWTEGRARRALQAQLRPAAKARAEQVAPVVSAERGASAAADALERAAAR